MSKDYFDLDSIDDLPDDCKAQIKWGKHSLKHPDKQKLLELFNHKNELTINEMIVGLYRAHGIKHSRTWIFNSLNTLYGNVKKVKGGAWRKVNANDE